MARFGEKHRTYDKWTAEELDMLGRNEVPPNRTVNQCRCKALSLGWKFRAPGSNRWTEPEVQMLREGKIPPGRTESAALSYCLQHRMDVPFRKDRKDGRMKDWPEEEIEMVKRNEVPPGRTVVECRFMARTRLGRGFTPENARKHREMMERGRQFAEQYDAGKSYAAIGKEYGLSRQRVQQVVAAYRKEAE